MGQVRARREGQGRAYKYSPPLPPSPNEVHWPSLPLFSEASKLIGRHEEIVGAAVSQSDFDFFNLAYIESIGLSDLWQQKLAWI